MNLLLTQLNKLSKEVRSGNFVKLLAQHKDLLLPIGVMLAAGTFFIPLHTSIISILIVLNLALSLLVLSRSLHIQSAVQLTSYPTLLLLTTMFRLCLSVSVARSILETGHAGSVIEALGSVTAGGNIIVGFVVFLIILVVQFIVVTKGAERVAEVAARFTLDAMPGKQMAIDADMRSGLITQDQARQLRSSLQKESQLYGAMDGAMKFVKGDSIATIIIAMINIIGGLAIGVIYHNMGFAQAMHKYTIMTVGDGLAAVMSSVFIAISAGFVVTRVSSDEEKSSIGSDIGQQLFTDPKPIAITAGALFALAIVPGMPTLPLSFVALGTAGLAYMLHRKQKETAAREAEEMAKAGRVAGSDELQPSYAVPLAVVVSAELTHLIDPHTVSGARFRRMLPKLRSSLYYDLGVMLPNILVSGDGPLKYNQYYIAIKEVPVVHGTIKTDCVFVNDSIENIKVFGLDGEEIRNPADLKPGVWIPAAQRSMAEHAGLKVWEPGEVITLHLSRVMTRYAHEFVGIQEAQGYLDFAARGMPKLVEEVVPKIVTIHQFTDVLQRLVQEGISIRDTKSLLDALAEWGRIEKDPVMLTEYVRSTMKRYISFRFTVGRDMLFVYLLDPEIEDVIRGAIRRTSTGTFLSLDPTIAHDILDALRRELAGVPPTAQKPVVITDLELRRFVRKMVELEFPGLSVLSYQELAPELQVQPVGRISMRPAQASFKSGEIPEAFPVSAATSVSTLAKRF